MTLYASYDAEIKSCAPSFFLGNTDTYGLNDVVSLLLIEYIFI